MLKITNIIAVQSFEVKIRKFNAINAVMVAGSSDCLV
jgi:hypothetical protein